MASLLGGSGILDITFGFASQDFAANFMAGLLLHFIHPSSIGDLIKSGGFLGYIDSMDLRSTVIRHPQGKRITIPHKFILSPGHETNCHH